MLTIIVGLIAGIVGIIGGFIIAMYVMRWAVSDLRDHANAAIRNSNAAEEVAENAHLHVRLVNKENGRLLNENQQLRNELKEKYE